MEQAKEQIVKIIKDRDYGSGVTYDRIKKFFKGSDETLNEAIDTLIDNEYINEFQDNRFKLLKEPEIKEEEQKPEEEVKEVKKAEVKEKPSLITQITTFAYNAFCWLIALIFFIAFLGTLGKTPIGAFFLLGMSVLWIPNVKLKFGQKFGLSIVIFLLVGFFVGSRNVTKQPPLYEESKCPELCMAMPDNITCSEFVSSEYCSYCYNVLCDKLKFKCDIKCEDFISS